MVGHESVDPKPQEKSDLVNGVIYCFVCFLREKRVIYIYREKKHGKMKKREM